MSNFWFIWPLKFGVWEIAFLNVDYKIASKVIATRFEKVLDLLISPDQTGFLKGRYIGQNIRLVNDVVEQTKIQNIHGILVQLDFCKAFETIEWNFIKGSLKPFNFGDSIQHWVSTFCNNLESTVLNNGFCTTFFKLLTGVRQGCPLSPNLFIVEAENLSVQNQTRQNNKRNNSLSKRTETKPVCRRYNSFMQGLQFGQSSYHRS